MKRAAPPPDEADAVPPALRADHPLLGLGYAKPLLNRTLTRLDGDDASPGSAMVAEEVPVSLVYNMRPHVVMMATPADLEDFAVGFTLTEGIVESVSEIARVEVDPPRAGHRSPGRHPRRFGGAAQVAGPLADRAHRLRTLRRRIDPGRSHGICNR